MLKTLAMPAKIANLGFLKIKIFYNKGYYHVIVFLHDFTNKLYHVTQIILYMWSCDQSFVTVALL